MMTGIDPNIIGRIGIHNQPDMDFPDIKAIIVTDLTPESHGNATGIGLADVITKRLHDKTDFQTTYQNVRTTTFLERAKIPVVAATPQEAFEIALRSAGVIPEDRLRVIRIRDTLDISELYVSKAILDEIQNSITVTVDFTDMFDRYGNLTDFQ